MSIDLWVIVLQVPLPLVHQIAALLPDPNLRLPRRSLARASPLRFIFFVSCKLLYHTSFHKHGLSSRGSAQYSGLVLPFLISKRHASLTQAHMLGFDIRKTIVARPLEGALDVPHPRLWCSAF